MIKKIKNPLIEKSKFLIIPEPFENEIFSSWFARCAYAHKTHPKTFWYLHFPLDKFTYTVTSNIDASLPLKIIERIRDKTSFNIEKIYNMTMLSYSGYLQEKIIGNGVNKFLSNYRFCPKCWKNNIPYLRKENRIVFSTFCKKHMCYLQDRCPQCNTLISFFYAYKNKLEYNFCNKCGFELSKTKVRYIKKSILVEQNIKLLEILDKGYIELKEFYIYSFLFFEIIYHIGKLILLKKKIFVGGLENKILKKMSADKALNSRVLISQLSIKEQFDLFGIIMEIFDFFPKNLNRYIIENKLSNFEMIKDMKTIPFWYETILNKISPKTPYCASLITTKEIEHAIQYLKSKNIVINQASLTNLLDCNFFSSYNKLSKIVKNVNNNLE